MIKLRPSQVLRATPGDLDKVFAKGVTVHLEVLADNHIMLILEDENKHVHLRISHKGKSPIRVWEYEVLDLPIEGLKLVKGRGNG